MAQIKLFRLTEDIKRELCDVMRELKDPRINGLISVVKVDLTNDLSHCKVYVSSLDGMESAKEAVKGLKNASGYIRREMAARVKMRRSPEFSFVADDSISKSAEISKLLNEISHKE